MAFQLDKGTFAGRSGRFQPLYCTWAFAGDHVQSDPNDPYDPPSGFYEYWLTVRVRIESDEGEQQAQVYEPPAQQPPGSSGDHTTRLLLTYDPVSTMYGFTDPANPHHVANFRQWVRLKFPGLQIPDDHFFPLLVARDQALMWYSQRSMLTDGFFRVWESDPLNYQNRKVVAWAYRRNVMIGMQSVSFEYWLIRYAQPPIPAPQSAPYSAPGSNNQDADFTMFPYLDVTSLDPRMPTFITNLIGAVMNDSSNGVTNPNQIRVLQHDTTSPAPAWLRSVIAL